MDTSPKGQEPACGNKSYERPGVDRGSRLAPGRQPGAVRTDEHRPRRIAGAVA